MGIFSSLLGGSVAQPVEAVGNVMDKLFTSDDERLTHEEVRLRLAQKPHLAQIELNKIEAAHRSIFVAGWRPAIGWVCAAGLGWQFVMQPWIIWMVMVVDPSLPPLPAMDT
ncbi:MAG: 3TM-type holin, partial [Mariprofundaceae bacterium]|nr:3TM-type holin [Mariprofundaceae bacterium]